MSAALSGAFVGPVTSVYPNLFVGSSPAPPTAASLLPLEVRPADGFEPVYRFPLDVPAGEIPALPLSIFGAVALARPAGVPDSQVSASEFFIYLFDSVQAGLAGVSFDEGRFGTLGYVTEGQDVLRQMGKGDSVVRVRVLSGAERLVRPATPSRAGAGGAATQGGAGGEAAG